MDELDKWINKFARVVAMLCITVVLGVTLGFAIIYWKWTILIVIVIYILIWMVKTDHQEFKDLDDD